MTDDIVLKILAELQENARTSAAEIARRIGLAPSAVHNRIRKLEEEGVVQAYEAHVNPRAVGLNLVSFVRVQTGPGAQAPEITRALGALPEVQEVHRVVGEDCFFVKVRVRDTEALAHLLDYELQRIPGVASTKTTIVLTTTKETRALPLRNGNGTHPDPDSNGA